MVSGTNRIVFWFLATVTVVVLLFGYHTSTSGPAATVPAVIGPPQKSSAGSAPSATSGSGSGSTATGGSSSGASSGSSSGSSGKGAAARTVKGDQEQTQWGPVEVDLTVAGGKISDVRVPVYPNGNGRDAEINSFALPQLIQETISAQNANIDMVSGATVTSDGYVRSLQSALDKAGL
jgi:major membrane immunogen (membrane-anchored lipoprotein)